MQMKLKAAGARITFSEQVSGRSRMSGFTKFVKRPADLSPTDHYRLRQLKNRFREHARQGTVPTLEQITHPENLIQVYRDLQRKAGRAPGIDGVTYADL